MSAGIKTDNHNPAAKLLLRRHFLAKYHPPGTARVLADMSMRLTFYLTEDAKYRLSNFMKHCGFDLEGEKKSYSQWISELPGAQFVGTIGQTMSDDGERMYSNITRTAPVEA